MRDRHDHILAGGDAAEHATGMIGEKPLRRQFVAMFGAALHDRRETRRRSRPP